MLRKGLSVWEGTRSCLGLSCQQWSVIFALGPFFGQCSQKLPKNRKKKSSVRRREKLFGSQLLASDDLHIILTLRPIFFGKCSQKLPKNCKKLLREKAVEVVLDSAACQRWSIILTLQGRWASMGAATGWCQNDHHHDVQCWDWTIMIIFWWLNFLAVVLGPTGWCQNDHHDDSGGGIGWLWLFRLVIELVLFSGSGTGAHSGICANTYPNDNSKSDSGMGWPTSSGASIQGDTC